MGKTLAITGAAGHLGRDLLAQILDMDFVDAVVALDVSPLRLTHRKLRFVQKDVRAPDMADALAGCDTLVHLAFIVESSQDLVAMDAINVGGTQNTLEAAARAGVRHVVYTSSIASYGFHPENRDGPLTEDAPRRGSDAFLYSRNKAQVEAWLDTFEAAHPQIGVCRLRPSAFLSSDSTRPIAAPLRGRFFFKLPGEDLPVHVTHQHDVVEAIVLALQQDATGAYNVASDDPLPMRAWGRAMGKRTLRMPGATRSLLKLAYKTRLIDVEPAWFTVAATHPIVVSTEKIRRELGWKPRFPTTAIALREIAGRSTACASRPTQMVFGNAATRTRWRGGIDNTAQEKYEVRTISGSLNFLMTGEHPSEWHATFERGVVGIHCGMDPRAKATITLPDATFHELLAGKTTVSACQLTGRIRFSGVGEFAFFLGAFVQRFKTIRGLPGLRAWPGRYYTGLVLKRAGLQPARSQG